jgi:hypothetical protein
MESVMTKDTDESVPSEKTKEIFMYGDDGRLYRIFIKGGTLVTEPVKV